MGTFTPFEAATGILQKMYGPMVKQIDDESPPLWKILSPNSDLVSGQEVEFSAQIENPQGVYSRRTASQAMGAAVPGKYLPLTVGTGRLHAILEFDNKMLKAAGQNARGRNAYINIVEAETKGIKNTVIQELSRQLFGTKKGFLTSCTATGTGAYTVTFAAGTDMRLFVEGQYLDIVTTADGVAITHGEARIITAVNVDTLTVTLDTAGGVVTCDTSMSVTRQGAYDAEMTGLSQIVSDTEDIYGVTTALQRRWKAYVAGSTGAFTVKAMEKVALAAATRSGVFSDLIVSSATYMQQYWDSVTGTPQFDVTKGPVEKLGFGYWKINMMIEGHNMEWISDPYCPASKIYGLRKEDIGIQHLGPMAFMDDGNGILMSNAPGVNGTLTSKAVLEYYPELICKRRCSHWVMPGVTDMSGW